MRAVGNLKRALMIFFCWCQKPREKQNILNLDTLLLLLGQNGSSYIILLLGVSDHDRSTEIYCLFSVQLRDLIGYVYFAKKFCNAHFTKEMTKKGK